MANTSNPDGRNVRRLNESILELNTQMINVLTEPLGDTDPVVYHRALKRAIRLARDINYYAKEIDLICILAAKHGGNEE